MSESEAKLDEFADSETQNSDKDKKTSPKGWRDISIIDLCEIGGGSTPKKSNPEYWEGGNILWTTPKDFNGPRLIETEDKITKKGAEESTSKIHPPGTSLLVVRSGVLRHTLPVMIAETPTSVNQDIKALEPHTDDVLPEYFFQALSGLSEDIRGSCKKTGTTVESIQTNVMEQYPIPVPPLEEQEKIATVLYTVDQAIQKTEKIIEQKEIVKRGLMQDIFRYGLTSDDEVRQPENEEPFEDTKYGTVPEGWNIVPLDSLVPDDAPVTYGIVKPGDHHPEGVPVVKVENIMDGKIDDDNLLHTDPEIHEKYKRAELQSGDLLFTIRGTVGRMAFVPDNLEGANLTQDTARIRVDDANPQFVRYYLETATPNNYFERHTKGQAVQGINLEDLREVPVHLPTEEEQNRIVEILDSHTEQIQTEREYLNQLWRLKQGLVQDLLSGEVRTHNKDIEVIDDVLQYG